jgi:hypothetical protein
MPEKPMPAPVRGRLLALLATLTLILTASPAGAMAPDATMALCRNAAIAAADRHGVPREVMLAITQVETRTKRGGQSGPWPWTVNVAGKGDWFDSRAAALLHAQEALAAGQNSFDVGCFQLNHRWHGEHFPSVDAMFEPEVSGDYAARFLKDLYAEAGDWIVASGHYHSRTPVHATRYRDLVARTIDRMDGAASEPVRLAGLTEPRGAAAVVQPRSAAVAGPRRSSAAPVRVAAVRAPMVIRAAARGAGPVVHGVNVRTPRGTGRMDGAAMVLRAPAAEVLALR